MSVVTTISEKCQRCYACVRNCPVKAIKVDRGQAKIIEERCIACGSCVRVCAQKAKKVASDISKAEYFLAVEKEVIAIVAPSFPAAFPEFPADNVLSGLYELGFHDVEEVSLGVQLTIPEYKKLIEKAEFPVISSFCPAVVGLIEKHYPDLIKYLAPIDTAMIACGKYIKKHRKKARVVFIGPCVAKKEEARLRGRGVIDAVLTFKELKKMFHEKGIDLKKIKSNPNILHNGKAKLFPLPGGLLANLGYKLDLSNQEFFNIEGRENCFEIIKNLSTGAIMPRFVDILFCNGCIDGPEIDSDVDLITRRNLVAAYARRFGEQAKISAAGLDLKTCFVDRHVDYPVPSEEEIKEILKLTYKIRPEDELNCGSCGYDTCREQAIAAYQGLAEIDMCFPYLLHKSRGEIEYYRNRLNMQRREDLLDAIIGESLAMKKVKQLVERAAATNSTVLVIGESGVGKEVIAQAIHNLSSRRDKPFIGINCAALPELLLESELFGYEEGAFTGARKGGKPGKFDLAHGGTILLDEIGDMPLNMQAKLLRVLQERQFERIGGTNTVEMDVRILAATNKPLKQLVQKGKFRIDLYYRLNVLNIYVPALRERKEDIPLLIGHFMEKMSIEKRVSPKIVSDEAMEALVAYDWPGNVRELENVLERAMIIADGNIIKLEHLPAQVRVNSRPGEEVKIKPLKQAVQELEKSMIENALKLTNNNRVNAAELLGIPRATLYQKLKQFGLL
ncbi:sigma-54-dependent Fis family transcriptional regulator [Thermincola potens]|uniref:Sigma54 specific transcriptional regulator, Fis family n=1 Tax=Thermincola potens (strain JR) TaxID=635013 RepID=D5XDS5_THEPJ|nr:sigma-54-dependent Fis family transcriptional regulator [Thermincola potens]ADG83821.1 sigma54 specific transcriptional regulator, Fis family [Thermincola potens JR]